MKKTLIGAALVAAMSQVPAHAQAPGEGSTETDVDEWQEPEGEFASDQLRGELYGFIMADMGYNAGTINEDWYDVMRPSKLPNSQAQEDGDPAAGGDKFPSEGNTYASVRQTRIGVKSWIPTEVGEIHTHFEFEFFGVGSDAGQTTIRLRHAYGEWGDFGAGQYWSPFMDINVFPNSQEYWGPSGMPFFRNIQFRWMPMRGANSLTFALEKPGASRDPATQEIEDSLGERRIRERYPVPDLSGAYKHEGDWGYFRVGGILRYIEWEDDTKDGIDLSDEVMGWGINLSSNIKLGPNGSVLKLLVMHGEGVQNYMNDAGGDIGLELGGGKAEGQAIPVTGTVLFYDYYWSERWSSTIGFSTIDMDNTNGQAANTYHKGRYALTNLQYHPSPKLMFGAELQYGKRENFEDGWDYDAMKVQFSARYNWSFGLGDVTPTRSR